LLTFLNLFLPLFRSVVCWRAGMPSNSRLGSISEASELAIHLSATLSSTIVQKILLVTIVAVPIRSSFFQTFPSLFDRGTRQQPFLIRCLHGFHESIVCELVPLRSAAQLHAH
jgi:hypothetical protein